jgi:histidine triad (HIT) family protein
MDCLFCKIAAGEIPSDIVYQDEQVVAFKDISPAAPVHVLVIPKKHIASLLELQAADAKLAAHILTEVVPKLAKKLAIDEKGFRLVANTKEDGGQTVNHLHFHLLGGRSLKWPPG